MRLFAGIDGGQSATKAAIVDDAGTVVGRGLGGPADHIDEPGALERLQRAASHAVERALKEAGLPVDTRLAGVVAGITGFGGVDAAVAAALNADRVRVVHDAPIALAGALNLQPGIVAIAGTGSVVFGRNAAGESAGAGGWGFLFGDQGSAFWIARRAVERAAQALDAGEPEHRLGLAALAYFDVPSLRDLAKRVYDRTISRERFAGFARLVSDAARLGGADAAAIFDEGAAALASACVSIAHRLAFEPGGLQIAAAGGTFASTQLRERFTARIAAALPRATVVDPIHEPAVGAALMARGGRA